MSKKTENEAFKEGMAEGVSIVNDKMDAYAKQIARVETTTRKAVNGIDEAIDDLIDASEEYDERISKIENSDYDSITKLTDNEKNILSGLLKMMSLKFELNFAQMSFMTNVLSVLNIEVDKINEYQIDKIDDVTSTMAQKTIYKVLCELMFLEKENTEYSKDFEEMCSYFAVGKRAKDAILMQIENAFLTMGQQKFVTKYKMAEERKKKEKVYPKLDVYIEYFRLFEKEIYAYELDDDDAEDLDDKFFRSEYSCREAYGNLLVYPLNLRDSYINEYSNLYIGTEITDHYAMQIEKYINEIIDYITIHKVRMDVGDLLELRDNCREYILKYTKDAINSVGPSYKMKSLKYYKDMLTIEEMQDYVSTLFGGYREVTRYILDYERGIFWATEQMASEVTLYLSEVINKVTTMVLQKYIVRIRTVVAQINESLGTVEVDKDESCSPEFARAMGFKSVEECNAFFETLE